MIDAVLILGMISWYTFSMTQQI